MVVVVPQAVVPDDVPGTGAFRDFLDLRTAVIEYVQRPDVADVFTRFVALAESRLNRTLRMREQVKTVTLTVTSGVAALPEDFAEMIGLYAPGGGEYVQQTSQQVNAGGCYYAIEGGNIVAPHIAGDVEVSYYAMLPPLSASTTTTNWLLTRYPDIYLYGVGFEAAKHVRDAELAQASKFMLDDAIATARSDDFDARYSRARVRVSGVTP